MEDHHHHKIHIAVFAFPFGSHGTPLLNIVRRLTSLSSKNNLHFSFFSSSNSIDSLFPQGSETFSNIRPYKIWDNNIGIDQFFNDALRKGALMEEVRKVEEEIGIRVKSVMGDAFLWFLGELGKEIGVPWVSCWVSGEHALCVHLYTDFIRQKFGNQGIEEKEEETLNFIPGLSKIRVKDIPSGIITGNCESPFAQMVHKMSQVITNANAVCISSCEELDPVVTNELKSKFSKLFSIGPLNLVIPPSKGQDTYNCLTWLDKQKAKSVVYVSFGSAATPPPNELFALAEALLESGVHFLWSIKDRLKVHFPTDFLENTREKGMIVPWVPQIDVLAHDAIGVFITHFGYNSMTESIAAQVPMIGRPFFGDHSLNGRLVEAVWEIGLQVDGGVFTKEGVIKSLDRILSSDEGKKMRENIKNINKLVGQGVAPNGSSNNNFRLLLDFLMKA